MSTRCSGINGTTCTRPAMPQCNLCKRHVLLLMAQLEGDDHTHAFPNVTLRSLDPDTLHKITDLLEPNDRMALRQSHRSLRHSLAGSRAADVAFKEVVCIAGSNMKVQQMLQTTHVCFGPTDLNNYMVPYKPHEVRAMMNVIEGNSNLEAVHMHNVRLGSAAIEQLTNALNAHPKIKALTWDSHRFDQEDMSLICWLLENNTTLVKLKLSLCSAGIAGIEWLAHALTLNEALEEVEFNNCTLGNVGARALSRVILDNPRLRTLRLAWCNIKSPGTKHLASALTENTSLQDLDLRYNFMTNAGARYLADALRVNTSLKNLYLDENKITQEGVDAFGDVRLSTNVVFVDP